MKLAEGAFGFILLVLFIGWIFVAVPKSMPGLPVLSACSSVGPGQAGGWDQTCPRRSAKRWRRVESAVGSAPVSVAPLWLSQSSDASSSAS